MAVEPLDFRRLQVFPLTDRASLTRADDILIDPGCEPKPCSEVVLSVGSAIMGPQVFEKSISCVNNIRRRDGYGVVSGHSIFVVDLQDGGNWDWTTGEPPKTNPAYYLRFCKSYSRMGGAMHYLQCDNAAFVHHLYRALESDCPRVPHEDAE